MATDTMQLSVSHADIKFYFVSKSGNSIDASKDMSHSFEVIANFSSSTEHLEWISEDNCLLLSTTTSTKKNIFIVDNFEGPVFDYLSSTAIVLGPRCVLSCQLTNDLVPIASPIFTLAMRNVVACVSGINTKKRSKIHKLIGFMGGLCTKDVTESNTHLITNTIKSEKYEKAALNNMNIMNEEWVFDAWTISKTEDISHTDNSYNKYKLPVFHELVVSSTGISEEDKRKIKELIEENGGTYSGSFKSTATDILITQSNQKNTEKFIAAEKCRKECLTVDWIKDSAAKGYALPFTKYRISTGQSTTNKLLHSTQISTQLLRTGEFGSNATQLSVVVNDVSIPESNLAKNTSQTKSSQSSVKAASSSAESESESININLFQRRTFALFGFIEENSIQLRLEMEEVGAVIVSDGDYSQIIDYLVISVDTNSLSEVKCEAKEIVTDLWIQECLATNEVVDIKYYHRPILLQEEIKPLQDLNIVFSIYQSSERDYLIYLAEALGCTVRNGYIRKESPILVCKAPEGQKYNGAIKWDLPVVSCDWLIKCYELEEKVPLNKYLVGDAKWQDDDIQKSAESLNKLTISSDATTDTNENNTPSRHPRVAAIANSDDRQISPLSQSPVAPVDSIANYVDDIPTPVSRQLVYDLLKECEDNEIPITITDSSTDTSDLDPPDYFDTLDKKFVEIPKTPPSPSFYEYRKSVYIEVLGDQYDGSPLRHPYKDNVEEFQNGEEYQNDEEYQNGEKSQESNETKTSVSTQVQNLGNFIKKCREDRKSIAEQHTTFQNQNNEEEEHQANSVPFTEVDINSENTEEAAVGWRDPDEFQSERFSSTIKRTKCFSVSLGVDVEDILMQQIIALNGTLCEDLSVFDPSCTHLICSKPNQSEKTLCVVAAGRWLLCVDYIEDSFNSGDFLNEEDYEWGNPNAKLPSDIDAESRKLATVSHKLRKELQLRSKQENKPVGIFSNFRVILHSTRKDSFKRLLEAGCGVVVDVKEPYSEQNDLFNVTHCIVDKRSKEISQLDLLAFKNASVHCVNILYLKACISSGNLVSVKDYLIEIE